MNNKLYDVVVVGAGPGGSATAYYLAKQSLDVLLLDKATFPRDKTCGDGLTPRALAVLDDMGLLDTILQQGWRVNQIKFVAARGASVTSLLPAKGDQPPYSLVIPRLILDNLIMERARSSGAAFQGAFNVTNLVSHPDYMEVRGQSHRATETSFRAKTVVIATGANIKLLVDTGLLKKPPRMMTAVRAYYTGLPIQPAQVSLHYNGVPLPGYGWVFPLSANSANIGLGICSVGMAAYWLRAKSHPAFEQFLRTTELQELLEGATRAGPVKGYPLRADFLTAPTYGERLVLVGEAAGLVNPLTGEGVDYALESGKLAAEQIGLAFVRGDLSSTALADYDRALRQRYQALFSFCNFIRDFLVNPFLIRRFVLAANQHPELKLVLINTMLGNQPLNRPVSARHLLKILPVLTAKTSG